MAEEREGWVPFDWYYGPIWKVIIAAPRSEGPPYPHTITVRALIDSGTSHTFALREVLDRLKLVPTGEQVNSHSGNTLTIRDNFRVDLALPHTTDGNGLWLKNHAVSDGSIAFGGSLSSDRRPYEMVVGCNLLRGVRFTMDGPAGLFRVEAA